MTTIEIGRITRPHGLRGEVRVQLHWEGSDTLEHVSSVLLGRKGQNLGEYRIASRRRVNKAYLVRFEGIDGIDAAEALRNAAVSVPRDALPPLKGDEFYLSDLIGAKVLGPAGPVGEVIEVRVHPTVDALVIRLHDGSVAEQPLVEPWLLRVDVSNKLVELASLDGLV